GQKAQLFIKDGLQIEPKVFFQHGSFGHLRNLPFPRSSSDSCSSCLQRRLVSHSVEPIGHHLPRLYGRSLSAEHEERGLEGILGVVMAEEATAYAPDHRAMPPHEGCEGSILPMLDEALQELLIGQSRSIRRKYRSAKVLDDLAHLVRRHVL